jgi:hypothetical protein
MNGGITVVSMPQVTTVTAGTPGIQGAPGGGGPGGSGDLYYLHTQSAAASMWTITHNLGKFPSVTIVDSAGDQVEGNVDHLSANSLTVTFSSAFGGRAFLN